MSPSLHLSVPVTPAPGGRLAAASRLLARAVARLTSALRHRRAVHDLLDMDDRTLRDIGLTRDDVRHALGLPLLRDPSVMLTVRSVGHRSRLRRAGPLGMNPPADAGPARRSRRAAARA